MVPARLTDFRSRLAHLHPGDSLDFGTQHVGGGHKQLPMEFLHLSGA
jgi:hypothetical protein